MHIFKSVKWVDNHRFLLQFKDMLRRNKSCLFKTNMKNTSVSFFSVHFLTFCTRNVSKGVSSSKKCWKQDSYKLISYVVM